MSDDNDNTTALLNLLDSYKIPYERTTEYRKELIHVSEPKMTIRCCDSPGFYTLEEKFGYWTLSQIEEYLNNPKGGPRLLLVMQYEFGNGPYRREESFPILCTDFKFFDSELYRTLKNTSLNYRLERTYASSVDNKGWNTDGHGPWLITLRDHFYDPQIYNNLQEAFDALVRKGDLVQCRATIMQLRAPKNVEQKSEQQDAALAGAAV